MKSVSTLRTDRYTMIHLFQTPSDWLWQHARCINVPEDAVRGRIPVSLSVSPTNSSAIGSISSVAGTISDSLELQGLPTLNLTRGVLLLLSLMFSLYNKFIITSRGTANASCHSHIQLQQAILFRAQNRSNTQVVPWIFRGQWQINIATFLSEKKILYIFAT